MSNAGVDCDELDVPAVIAAGPGEGLGAKRSDLVLGFKIMNLHIRFSSTAMIPPALSNSPQ